MSVENLLVPFIAETISPFSVSNSSCDFDSFFGDLL